MNRAKFNWLTDVRSLERLFERSNVRPVVLFKHSVRCGVSSYALERMAAVGGEVNVVVVQDHRDVSDAIESRTGLRHHTPQAFVIRNERAVYHASHYSIDPEAITKKAAE